MITAVIIDDEEKGRLALRQKLADHCPEIQLLGEAECGNDGIKIIEKHLPEIVFLDIEMPRMDGFEMLQQLTSKKFHLVFTTAYDQYAIKAIKYAAFDYLLKPVDIEELKLSISRINSKSKHDTAIKLTVLEENLKGKNLFGKIAISTLEGLLFFNTQDIVHLMASSNYTTIYFKNHPKMVASKTLKEFEEMLPSEIFYRTHHSHIVNLNYIKRYIKGDGGQIEMENGIFAAVSRSKKDDFLKTMGQ